MTHLSSAIHIVNERLRAPVPRITDATIGVVCTFAHTEVRLWCPDDLCREGELVVSFQMFFMHLSFLLTRCC
jgi:hypothetical protein